jgi:uncharacterized protein YbcV (DUF1398 family)
MNAEQAAVMRECAAASLAGRVSFPEVVGRLAAIGVERYHADYCRHEITYYLPSSESLVVPISHQSYPISAEFTPANVEAAIRQIQRGEIVYAEFLHKTIAAGCVGYFVQITGRRVLYFGRAGDFYLEPFPAPAGTDVSKG